MSKTNNKTDVKVGQA